MNSSTIALRITKSHGHPSSVNLLKVVTPPPISKKQSGQFGSALAHEIRNPLTNINLAVEVLKHLISDNAQQTYLDIIMRGSTRINDLINELLKSQSADNVHTEEYSIHQLLNEVIEMTEDRIRLKNIAIRKEFAARDIKIILNKPEMKIALTNIIINAIDAMVSEKGELKLVTKSIGGKYVIHIEDNGCGISKANLKNIFKPFFTNKPGGLGLGLAKTYNILQSNQVGINVESEEGRGTRFILSFNKTQQDNLFQSKN